MANQYSLSINGGAAVSAAAIGCRVKQRRRINQGVDTCSLEFSRRFGDPLPIAHRDIVHVTLDGAGFFYGTAICPRLRDDENGSSVSVEVRGPWHNMQELWFARGYGPHPQTGDLDPGDTVGVTTVTESDINYYLSTRSVLGMWTSVFETPTMLAIDQQVEDIVEYARKRLLTVNEPAFTLPAGWLDITAQTYALPEEFGNLRCNDGVTKCLRWFPDAAAWFDYQSMGPGDLPALRIHRMAAATPTALAMGRDVATRELALRHDMRVDGVVIRFEHDDATDGFRLYEPYFAMHYPPGAQINKPRTFVHCSPIPSGYAVPTNLAEVLYGTLSQLVAEGSLVMHGGHTPATQWRPGSVITLTGDAPSWVEGAALYVQEVIDDCASGATTLRCGYPGHLGVTDLKGLSESLVLGMMVRKLPASARDAYWS